jgi:hypothetical protein
VVAVAGFTSGAGAGGPVELGDRLVAFGDIESGHALLLSDLLRSAEPAMQIEALFAVTMGLKHPVTLTRCRCETRARAARVHRSALHLPMHDLLTHGGAGEVPGQVRVEEPTHTDVSERPSC